MSAGVRRSTRSRCASSSSADTRAPSSARSTARSSRSLWRFGTFTLPATRVGLRTARRPCWLPPPSTHALRPRARILAMATAGSDPVLMLTAPAPASLRALQEAGMSTADVDLAHHALHRGRPGYRGDSRAHLTRNTPLEFSRP
jgi:acetyl-CoA acetyltransferase